MSSATVIFPHQLFADHPGLDRGRRIVLVEDQLFFRDWRYPARFHKHKLILHRASMRAYATLLRQRGYDVSYLEYAPDREMSYLFAPLRRAGVTEIVVAEVCDFMLEKRVRRYARQHGIRITELSSPGFLTPRDWLLNRLQGKQRLSLTSFYIAQRKRMGILLDNGKPRGGRWTYDTANRQPLPKNLPVPPLPTISPCPEVRAAIAYVTQHWPDHPGEPSAFWLPITHAAAAQWLQHFLEHRVMLFGPYQDAMRREEPFLFHSVLSPLLNIGLLTPTQVLEAVIAAAREKDVPLPSLEGFIRQLIGWREFVRGVYLLHGVRQRTSNHCASTRPMPSAFYHGTTGLLPFDTVVARVQRLAYSHHIERLMILGNLMLLCGIHPDAVYTWFMELFLDAYDWVMVPNVYGMSQYADGGLMTTKPYVCSSRYIRRMSDYPRGAWCEVWDALYWQFIDRQRATLEGSPRTAVMPRMYDRFTPSRRAELARKAEQFLAQLT
ncbi:MAG: cryptochrome/photolyase family protein [bacterium]|nr:cryptochrome/photolyase family protein [bacterium]